MLKFVHCFYESSVPMSSPLSVRAEFACAGGGVGGVRCQALCPCLHPLVTGPNRSQLKLILGIEDVADEPYSNPHKMIDLCLHCWFPCCTTLQVRLGMRRRQSNLSGSHLALQTQRISHRATVAPPPSSPLAVRFVSYAYSCH